MVKEEELKKDRIDLEEGLVVYVDTLRGVLEGKRRNKVT